MIIEHEINDLLAFMQKKISTANTELSRYPKGHLTQTKQNGKDKLTLVSYDHSGKRVRRTINNNNEIISMLRREYIKAELDSLQHDYNILSKAASKCRFYSPASASRIILNFLPCLDPKLLQQALQTKRSEWSSEPYEQSNYKIEERRHLTSRGEKMRSKSEAIIAESLYKYELDARYEQVINISGVTFIPDFTIRRRDGKIYYWEHVGLTNQKNYLEHQLKKMQMYAGAGIVPWDNLIVTYDNAQGEIDIRIIESEIKNKLLI